MLDVLRKSAERAGYPRSTWSYLLVVEPNRIEGSCHAHLLIRGKAPPEDFWVAEWWKQARSTPRVLQAEQRHSSYILKGARQDAQDLPHCHECRTILLRQHLTLNARRQCLWTPRFFVDGNGEPITKKTAIDVVRQRRRDWNPEDWGILRV